MRPDPASNLIEREATEKKLSKVKRGHWRNLWGPHSKKMAAIDDEMLPNGNWLGGGRWPSREVAEEKGLATIRDLPACGAYYLGPVFFPEEDQP